MLKRCRIVQVIASSDGVVGDVEKHCFALCAALAKTHDVHLLAHEKYRQYCDKQVQFHSASFYKGLWAWFSYWQLAHKINIIQPDIVHTQAAQATRYFKYIQWFFKHIKFIATVHHQPCLESYQRSHGVIVLNKNSLNEVNASQVRLIYQGIVPPNKATPRQIAQLRQQLLVSQTQPLLIAVGELEANQGFEVLFNAMVNVDAQLIIVGEGTQRAALEVLAHELAIKPLFLGARDDVDLLLQIADLCVVPSLQTDSSLIVIKALQASCPVVATNIIGFKEWLSPALLFLPNDATALHDTLCATIRGLATLKANYLPIFLRAQQELTLEYMIQQTEHFYFDLLEST